MCFSRFLIFTIRQTNPTTGCKRVTALCTPITISNSHLCVVPGVCVTSTLHLVDLAGSEQLKQSLAQGERRREAIDINSSLLVLGKCIAALVKRRSHVPYYESPLTLMLKDAIGGSSRTHVVVTCSIDEDHGDQTLHSLRFGGTWFGTGTGCSLKGIQPNNAQRIHKITFALDRAVFQHHQPSQNECHVHRRCGASHRRCLGTGR